MKTVGDPLPHLVKGRGEGGAFGEVAPSPRAALPGAGGLQPQLHSPGNGRGPCSLGQSTPRSPLSHWAVRSGGGRALPPELQVATPATEDGTVVALPRSRTAAALGPEASAGSLGAGRPGSCRGRSGFRRRSLQAPPPRASLRSPCPQQLQGGPQVPSLGMRGFSGRDSPLHRSTCGCMPVLVFTPACTHMCVCVCVNTCVSPGTQAWRAQG